MNEFDWIKKYKAKLGRAWRQGLSDELAAKSVGISERELIDKLQAIPELAKYREDRVDKILISAQKNVAKAIEEGDVRLSQWYIDKMEHRFGKIDVVEEPEDESVDAFLDGFSAKGGSFDEQ